MQLIALTGGIASGKSVVAHRLKELGAVCVDADVLAREVVAPGSEALAAIARHFGSAVVGPDGFLDRTALGAIIFADPAQRAVLNGITHPAVGRRSRELFAAAETADPHAIVVYDVPLLVESSGNRGKEFDLVVVVIATIDTRIARLITLRGMTRAEALARISSQATDEERRAIADVVIDSNGSLEHTLEQVDALWEQLAHPTRAV